MLPAELEKHGRGGLGGEGILRTYGESEAARKVIEGAITHGITYFDCAHVYADSEIYYGTVWGEQPNKRQAAFQASKSASRDKEGALADLESTLQRMKIPFLDLWQIHDVRTQDELKTIGGPGGALEAFWEAKEKGKTRFIGVTGHHDPAVLTQAVAQWPVDSVMMPVNPAEKIIGGFLTSTLPAAIEKGIAVIGMKILGASHYVLPRLGISAESLIRFALDQGIHMAIVGCATVEEVRILAETTKEGKNLSEEEQSRLLEAFAPQADRLAFYRGVI